MGFENGHAYGVRLWEWRGRRTMDHGWVLVLDFKYKGRNLTRPYQTLNKLVPFPGQQVSEEKTYSLIPKVKRN